MKTVADQLRDQGRVEGRTEGRTEASWHRRQNRRALGSCSADVATNESAVAMWYQRRPPD